MRGQYILNPDGTCPEVLPNTVPNEGEVAFLKMLLRGDASFVVSGGNFYVGLTDVSPVDSLTLSGAAAGEPTSQGGYARQAITRDTAGWPTLRSVNGENSIRSAPATFSASGADFSKSITRAFLTDTLSGTSGTLFSISAALASGQTVTDGNTLPISYELYLY